MWNYLKRYIWFGIAAAIIMVGEVCMDLLLPSLMSGIVDTGVLGAENGGTPDLVYIAQTGFIMLLCAILGCACGSANNVFTNICIQRTGNDIRKDVFKHTFELSEQQVTALGCGSLITRVTNDVTQVEHFVEIFVRSIVRTGLTMIGAIVFMFYLNPTFGLVTLCAFPVALVLLVVCLKVTTPMFARLQRLLDGVNACMQEDLGGIRTIKAYVRQETEKARFGKANAKLIATQLKALLVFALLSPAMNMLMYLVIAILLAFGGYQAQAGLVTPGVVMAAITYATQLLNAVLRLVMMSQELSRGAASWARIKEVLASKPQLADGSAEHGLQAEHVISFKNVCYRYPGDQCDTLHDITLDIPAGSTVAIMGPTGCGKSTLVKLMARFMDPTLGSVAFDGVDVREWRISALRGQISCALQTSELFSDSVRNNVSWGAPHATDEQLQEALNIAQAAEFVEEMPEGTQSILAERGMSLSGGQRQRLCIARAVAKAAPLLIFDDATSALDLRCEAQLHAALREQNAKLKQRGITQTVVMVAQRIASVRNADFIVVLDEGAVAAVGTHDELLATCTTYQEIYASQFAEEGVS